MFKHKIVYTLNTNIYLTVVCTYTVNSGDPPTLDLQYYCF